MGGDNPEQRIADLEGRLAKPTPAVAQAGALDVAQSRTFMAFAAPPSTKQMMRYTSVAIAVAIATLGMAYMLLFLVGAIVGSTAVMQVGGFVVFFGFFLGAMPGY